MTDKEKYDFIDHVVHLTIFVEDRLLDEHGGEYSKLEEDGIDSNEYYRIITERVINILKKNNNYMQEEPVSIWHDSNEEQPEGYRTVVIWNPSTMDGEVLTRCAEVYKGRIWAYIEDLLNLSNVQRTIKDCKDEPVSEDLEKISYYFACMCHPLKTEYSISSPNPEIIKAFKAGAKWQFEKVTEALLSEVLPCFMHGGEADEVVAKLDEVLNFQKK